MVAADAPVPDIPDKAYFRIGEVSRLVGVDTHVLRYWESEFTVIRPFRGKSKQRLYRRQDVDNLLQVKQLLHEQGYTIAGARKILSIPKAIKQAADQTATPSPDIEEPFIDNSSATAAIEGLVESVLAELRALQQLLAKKKEP